MKKSLLITFLVLVISIITMRLTIGTFNIIEYIEYRQIGFEYIVGNDSYLIESDSIDTEITFESFCMDDINQIIDIPNIKGTKIEIISCLVRNDNIELDIAFIFDYNYVEGSLVSFNDISDEIPEIWSNTNIDSEIFIDDSSIASVWETRPKSISKDRIIYTLKYNAYNSEDVDESVIWKFNFNDLKVIYYERD